jgi:AcrR family transcriptional regulator
MAAKQISRQKILDSAMSLFAEKGYDGATIREIAAGAGVSTGAVFNSFADKYEVFAEIVEACRKTLWDDMSAAARGETIDETLRLMFDAGCRFAMQNLKLMQCAISVSWSAALGAELRARAAQWSIPDLLAHALSAAVASGELARETNVPLVAQTLADCFFASCGEAAFSGWERDEFLARLTDQTALLLGPRPSDAASSFGKGPAVSPLQMRRRAR